MMELRMAKTIERRGATALLARADWRYLMQGRDPKLWILLPGHWRLFGGSINESEGPESALRREFREELAFEALTVSSSSSSTCSLHRRVPIA
jgi:8-oxo-dGTP pyrophosphatase MutT (NUDIX family)